MIGECLRNFNLGAADFFVTYSPENFALAYNVTIGQDDCSSL
jgi:hypothetical protein